MCDLVLTEEEIRIILTIRECENKKKKNIKSKRIIKKIIESRRKKKEKRKEIRISEEKVYDLIGGEVLIESKTKGLLKDLL